MPPLWRHKLGSVWALADLSRMRPTLRRADRSGQKSLEAQDRAERQGHTTSTRRLAIDWDGTCVENAYPEMGDWLLGAPEALTKLSEDWELVIFSCRVANFMTDEVTPIDGNIEADKIRAMLKSIDLPQVEVWTKPYKPPAFAYIDDRGLYFTTWEDTLVEIRRRLGD